MGAIFFRKNVGPLPLMLSDRISQQKKDPTAGQISYGREKFLGRNLLLSPYVGTDTQSIKSDFEEFYNSINLPNSHRLLSNSRTDALTEHIKKRFLVREAFTGGSIPKYTALKDYADLDLFIVLESVHSINRTPADLLQNMRDCLGGYRAGISKKNGQAVTVYFDTWPQVDVVPVLPTELFGSTSYLIPDMNRQNWITSNPKEHATDIANKTSLYGSEFRKIIKMVKWWNKKHGDYLQSYHIEVLALQSLSPTFTNYAWELYLFFDEAVKSIERTISGAPNFYKTSFIDTYLNNFEKYEILKRLQTAKDKACQAWYSEIKLNDFSYSKKLWNQVFNRGFTE